MNGLEKAWQNPSTRSASLLIKTLDCYNLIGLHEEELVRTVGKGETRVDPERRFPDVVEKLVYYDLSPNTRCGNAHRGVEFGLDRDGKVWGWRIRGFDVCLPWVTDNVVVANHNDFSFDQVNLIRKNSH